MKTKNVKLVIDDVVFLETASDTIKLVCDGRIYEFQIRREYDKGAM